MEGTKGWIVFVLFCIFETSSSLMIPYNVTHPCHRGMYSKMGSSLMEEVVTNCSNGTISWNAPMNYLEVVFVPMNKYSIHAICFGVSTSPQNLIGIIQNYGGELTHLPPAGAGGETCSDSHYGNFTIAFESHRIPRTFAIYLPFKIKSSNKPT